MENESLTKEKAIEMGFKDTGIMIGGNLEMELGRGRYLSLAHLGGPCEMFWVCWRERDTIDTVCLHNFDYDGQLTYDKLKLLIDFFNYKNK